MVVNARHVKNVPGRKTDVMDSEWLADLARCGLLRSSFIPPRDIRELRLLTRYRKQLSGILSGEKNRLHKALDECGIRLGAVVSDIDGVSAREMVRALLKGDCSTKELPGLPGEDFTAESMNLSSPWTAGSVTDIDFFWRQS